MKIMKTMPTGSSAIQRIEISNSNNSEKVHDDIIETS